MASETGSTIVLLEGKLEFDDVTLRAIADVYTSEGNKEIKKYRKKGYKNAIYFFTEGIKVNCKDDEINANLYSNRALAYFMLGSYQESLNDAKVATELQPTHIESLEMGARACLELHLYEEAIAWCNKGLAIVVSNSAILSDLWTECTNKTSPNTLTTTPDSRSVDGQESDVSLQQTVRKQVGLTAIKAHHLGSTNATLDDIKTATDHHKHLCKEKLRYRAVEGRTYGILGEAFRKLGDLETAISYFEKYLKIAKDVGDKASEGIASGCLGEAYKHLEDYRKALHYFEICLVIRKEVGDKAGEGNTLSNLGNVYWSLGDVKSAANCHEIHLQIAKELGDVDGQGIAYNNLGNIYRIFGKVEKAIDFHERHLKIAKELGDKPGEGIAYGNLGIAYRVIGDFKTAVDYHQLNLKIAKEVGDRSSEGTAYFNLGNDYHSLGDFKTSLSYHELSLKIAKKVGNRAQEGSACGCIGSMHTSLGNIQSAVHYLELHLKIAKELGKKDDEGMAYGRLGIAHHILGDLETAMVYYKDHLKIAKEVGDRGGEGNAYGNLGRAYNSIGEFKKAIEYFEKQLNVAKEMRNRAQEGIAYGGLGSTYQSLGNFKRAINYNELNLQIAKEVRDRAGEGRAYGNLGSDYLNVGNFKRAIDYHELHLGIAKEVGDKAGQGHAYGNLCEAYRRLGNYKKCMVHHELNLKIAKEVGDKAEEGRANCCIGNVYLNLEDFEKAVSCHTTYLKIAKEVGNRRGEGTAYGNLGVAHHLLGDYEKAIHYHGLHLEVAKEVGDRAAEGSACGNLGTVHCLLGEFEKAKHFNELHLKIAKETGDKAEEAKAYYFLGRTFGSMGSLLEAINHCESSVKILNDITFRAQFKDEMKIDLRHLYQNAYTALWCLYLTQGKILQALLAAEQGRAQALTHLMELNYGFETDVVDSHTLDETIYEKLSATSSNTVFIATGVKEIFFWVSSYDQKGKYIKLELGIKEISDNYWWGDVDNFFRSLIQDAFKEIGVRGGVKCEDRSLDDLRDETPANESPDQKNVSSSSLQLQSTSLRTLYDFIIAPVADFIHDSDIVIVPEGPLCLLPHAAFMDSNLKYLSESHRIRVVPSLTSLKLLADCPADYHCKTGVLLVGDPWVQEFKYKGRRLHQLPCAREEVDMIGRLLKTEPLTGTAATKDAVLQRLSSVALVHIAAHGRMETGEITLAPNPTRSSKIPTEKDFLLTMADVLSVQIRARLVVLSCCHSGRGEIKAEGVVGIARAFMGAGARSVLVSLWAIDDAATLEFMKIFYVHLAEGSSASEALKQAMKCMRESEKFKEEKYWAPFVLIGDDVTLEFGASD